MNVPSFVPKKLPKYFMLKKLFYLLIQKNGIMIIHFFCRTIAVHRKDAPSYHSDQNRATMNSTYNKVLIDMPFSISSCYNAKRFRNFSPGDSQGERAKRS